MPSALVAEKLADARNVVVYMHLMLDRYGRLMPSRAMNIEGDILSNGREMGKLTDVNNVIVILRLVLDQHGQLVHGQIVSMDGDLPGYFDSWAGLTQLLDTWLAQRQSGQSTEQK